MLTDVLFVLIVIACLAVVGVLGLGLGGFGKGSGWAKNNSNKLMRYRILTQAIAVGLIVLYVVVKRNGG
ncbi:twin transmembrane helix small protein [Ascidiaceihabitans sp.]|uniref:twin transmembrane helix small protein n=1 Tax=Ascidiaceihabitans sp. TaxID=1872644 RepID=UPI003298F387